MYEAPRRTRALVSLIIDVRNVTPTVVALAGELDAFTSRQLRDRLDQLFDSGTRELVIDLAALEFIDSTALGVLVGALKRARRDDGDVQLRGVTPAAKQVFDVSGLSRMFAL